jgi:cytochrome c nitrite reductase small subunit
LGASPLRVTRAEESPSMKRSGLLVLAACVIAIPAGIGAFTFVYAKGFSYLSTDPRACVNCHVMTPQYEGWLKSGHRHVATCVECHLPHAGFAKWLAKADHGFRHSAAFTLQNFKEPIEITPRDSRMVQTNCVRCHEDFVHAVVASPGVRGRELNCLHCHARAGHGAGG